MPVRGRRAHCIGLKVWSYGGAIPLSSRVPVLENMGFKVVDERTYEIRPGTPTDTHVWLHDMTLESADGTPIDIRRPAEHARKLLPGGDDAAAPRTTATTRWC